MTTKEVKTRSETALPQMALSLVPHRDAMLLLDELNEYAPEHGVGKTIVRTENIFLDNTGKLDNVCLVELLAQLCAAHKGYESLKDGSAVKNGYLAGISNFSFKKPARLGESLRLESNQTAEINDVVIISGTVHAGQDCLATGDIKIYTIKHPPSEEGELSPPVVFSDQKRGEPQQPNVSNKRSIIYNAVLNKLEKAKLSEDEGFASAEYCFDEGFPGFSGHFPTGAILPGVVMIDMSIALCETLLGSPLELVSIDRSKFLQVVVPGNRINVEVNVTESNEQDEILYRVRSKLKHEDKPAADLTFSIKKESLT